MDTKAAGTGRFWLCPVCHKHVPGRTDKCQCGFDRTTVNVAIPEAPTSTTTQTPTRDEGISGGTPWVVLAGFALAFLGAVWLWKTGQENDRANAELHDRMAQRQADRDKAAPPPQIILLPQGGQARQPAPVEPSHAEPGEQLARPALTEEAAPLPSQPPAPVVVPQERATAPNVDTRAQQEMLWRDRAMRIEANLVSTATAYVAAVCKEKLGGIPIAGVATYHHYREQYVQARAEADSLAEAARQAGIPSSWVSVRGSYPPPLPPDAMPSVAGPNELSAYNCGSH